MLPAHIKAQIPRSTLADWQNRFMRSDLFGSSEVILLQEQMNYLLLLEKHRRLFAVFRALVHINRLLADMIQNRVSFKRMPLEYRAQFVGIVNRFRNSTDIKRLLRMMGFSHQKLYSISRSLTVCGRSLRALCRTLHPQQLTQSEELVIHRYLCNEKFQHWSARSIYLQMLRDGAAFCSLSSFYNIAAALGFSRRPHKSKHNRVGIRADRPGGILHIDVTETRLTDHTKVFIYQVVDNFSRYVLRCFAALEKNAEVYVTLLKSVLAEHRETFEQAHPTILFCDKGSENKGALDEWIAGLSGVIEKMVALDCIQFSNSMAESANKFLKCYYIRERKFTSLQALQKFLDFYLSDFNIRPHMELHGLNPAEVFGGQIPTPNMFADQIAQAKSARVFINSTLDCNSCPDEVYSPDM